MPQFRNSDSEELYLALTKESKLVEQVTSDELGLLVLHVSEGCNLGCTYCFADRGHYGETKAKWMSPDDAVESVKQALKKYSGLRGIKFFGGEPLLNLDAIEAVCEYIKNDSELKTLPDLHAVTNMTVLSDRSIKIINDYGINLTGSIDGPPELHNKFRIFANGKGSFDKVDETIKKYRELTGQPKVLEVVYSPAHLDAGKSMEDVHRYLTERYGIPNIIIHPMEPHEPVNQYISERQWSTYRESMYTQASDYGEYFFSQSVDNEQYYNLATYFSDMAADKQKDSHCDLGVDTITITAGGEVYPCYTFIGNKDFVMAESPKEIGTTKFEDIQSQFISNKKSDNATCRSCSIYKTCHQCPGEMLSQTGSINSVMPVSCDFMTGFIEGILAGLNKTKNNPVFWSAFSEKLDINLSH